MAAAVVLGAGLATEATPRITTTILLPPTTHVGGSPPALAWPSKGEAALATATGTLIGTSGSSTAVPIASVTKVMTAYIVLRDHPLAAGQGGPTFTISASEAADLAHREALGQSLVSVYAGEVWDERQALQALLLASADNMAAALARFDAGSRAAFVAKMSSAASALGLGHTHFVDPSGYDPGSVSDSTDLVRLGVAAMAVPGFAQLVSESNATMPGGTVVHNYNTLLGTGGFDGIKTGSTAAAGQALLFSVSRQVAGRPVGIVGVVLRQSGAPVVAGALSAANSLADSFYAALGTRAVLPAGTPVAVMERAGRREVITLARALELTALPGEAVSLKVTTSVGKGAAAGAGASASATVDAAGATGAASVTSSAPLPAPPGFGWRLAHLFG